MKPKSLSVAGLFAGIGGIELGLHRAGHRSLMLCEIEPHAQAVLKIRFPDVPVIGDVRQIISVGRADVVAGGFPCQDLSQAGRTAGIHGKESGLVREMLRLCGNGHCPTWLLIENVPFMLSLDRGRAMDFLTDRLEALGFAWAYRVVDTRAWGLPQRRRRVILLASPTQDPRNVLFVDDANPNEPSDDGKVACGFYWTEGIRGLGWAVNGIPTFKGGSTIGIPSAPAIWLRSSGDIITPDIRDSERLQGFDADWTAPAGDQSKRGERHRWKLVGNAVSVPVFEWVGSRLVNQGSYFEETPVPLTRPKTAWPTAAWGCRGQRGIGQVSEWPVREPYRSLEKFLRFPGRPLSERAANGFHGRFVRSGLTKPDGFVEAVECHIGRMKKARSAQRT